MIRRFDQLDTESALQSRSRIFLVASICVFVVVLMRLFYWQIVKGSELNAEAEDQYRRSSTKTGSRGLIYTADGHVLVTNQIVYRAFAQPQTINQDPAALAKILTPLLIKEYEPYKEASSEADRNTVSINLEKNILEKLVKKDSKWVSLISNVPDSVRQEISALKLHGIGFDPVEIRSYPEASMAAQLTGFVGKNENGEDTGYFGIEGGLEQELKGRKLRTTVLTDALGQQLTAEQRTTGGNLNGRDVTLTIRRDLQNLAETKLKAGMEKYGARSGEVIILEPSTGKIMALATTPTFNPATFYNYDAALYQNPSLGSLYEPGSTFKILTVAAGLDEGVISPDTQCDSCSGARVYGQYTIKTWNDVYHPNTTMTEGLANSDNTAMIFIAEKLGADKLRQYLQNFGIGEPLHVDLQGDVATPFPKQWGPVELATISFGQGISVSSLQLVRAVSAIANEGVMMRPQIVTSVTDPATGQSIKTEPMVERTVVSKETAQTLSKMLIESARHGEAQWTVSRTHEIAGKTGTSQVAQAGGYDEDQTIASFIGFAPPQDPKFVMLVKLVGPTSSPWAAETAAPLWYSIAEDLFLALNIPPDRSETNE